MRHLHPFPARMAPELAMGAMQGLRANSCVLDPMAGSGTVLRHAALAGHNAIGFDMDPLAVLIAKVSSRRLDPLKIKKLYNRIARDCETLRLRDVNLPWIDNDLETQAFINYWFGRKQSNALRKLAYLLKRSEKDAPKSDSLDVLKIALSRIIVTKETAASLARDTSHSRPHKVREHSEYDVIKGYRRSVQQVLRFIENEMPEVDARVSRGDARSLNVADRTVDLVVTSPPYLNAIDYLRGHKLALVWLGWSVSAIREIRSSSIGAEKAAPRSATDDSDVSKVRSAMLTAQLPSRFESIVIRYAGDLTKMMREISRVLKHDGKAVLVVGDSCLRSEFISNSEGVKASAALGGLQVTSQVSRELPHSSRYLPLSAGTPLGKRMRTENVLVFVKA
jgi:SAM-dependent methyltransferase